jgi:ElaB/YqjD/DUF883 family membrane-anchored ribosome-binding protein
MNTHDTTADLAHKANSAAASVDEAMVATQRAARQALDSMVGAMQDLRDATLPLLEAGGEQAGDLVQRGSDEWRRRSRRLRQQARRASENTVNYIQDEPVAAVLIAAASGAALMALAGLFMRARRHD